MWKVLFALIHKCEFDYKTRMDSVRFNGTLAKCTICHFWGWTEIGKTYWSN